MRRLQKINMWLLRHIRLGSQFGKFGNITRIQATRGVSDAGRMRRGRPSANIKLRKERYRRPRKRQKKVMLSYNLDELDSLLTSVDSSMCLSLNLLKIKEQLITHTYYMDEKIK